MAKIGTGGWNSPSRIEKSYSSQIQRLFKPLFNVTKDLEKQEDIIDALNSMFNSPLFHKKAEEIAKSMATNLYTSSAKSWRQAARKSGKSKTIYEFLRNEMNGPVGVKVDELVKSNANLIRTLPLGIAQEVTEFTQRKSMEGLRASDIAKELKEMFPKRTKANANLIARTETSKASTALTQARSELLGHSFYIWRTSEDQRVRSSHAHMEGVICNYNNPPQPEVLNGMPSEGKYNAGEIYNCRCYAEPLIDYDQAKWPAKVHVNGKIERMSLAKFKELEEKGVKYENYT